MPDSNDSFKPYPKVWAGDKWTGHAPWCGVRVQQHCTCGFAQSVDHWKGTPKLPLVELLPITSPPLPPEKPQPLQGGTGFSTAVLRIALQSVEAFLRLPPNVHIIGVHLNGDTLQVGLVTDGELFPSFSVDATYVRLDNGNIAFSHFSPTPD